MATLSVRKYKKLSIHFELLNIENIQDLESINLIILPIRYKRKIYRQILQNGFGYLVRDTNERVIGGIGCIIKTNQNGVKYLYVISIAILTQYQRKGIGSMLIEKILDNENIQQYKIKDIILHCNVDLVEFYQSNGFQVENKINGYYSKMKGDESIGVEMKRLI